jgi:thiol:disulfide interchange protein
MTQSIIHKASVLLVSCFILLFNGVCHATSAPNTTTLSSKILWQSWSNAPFQEAKAKNRLVLVEIKADWCHWCSLTKDITFQNKDVIKTINSSYIPVQLDVDKNINVIRQFRATSLPTILILDTNHKIIKQFSGYMSPEDLIKKLKN